MTLKFECKECFLLAISILLLTDIVILLDILFLRQIFGFLFLTILPGLLILQILKLNKIELTEKFVLLVGLSIAFLMFFGLLVNNSSFILGYETPLATIPLLISFNISFIVLMAIGYKINKNAVFYISNINLTTSEKTFLIIPILFPALCIFGMYIMNTTDNNIVLMLLLFLISLYVIFVCFFNHKFPKRLYPVVIFLISISLLLLLSLRSNHIIGRDTHAEYYFFRTTLNNLQWIVMGYSTLDSCLSISLLPTVYQSILNVRPEFLFKIMYSLVYSISPLAVYILSKKYVGEFYGFLSSCFFMFQTNFLFTAYNARTNMAVLFFALAMMIFFNDRIDPLKKKIIFIVFMASCMVSHYATTYVFFFIILGALVVMEILSKKYLVKKTLSLRIVVLFYTMIFFWYSQVTEIAFSAGVDFIEKTLSNLNRFFVEESRGGPAQSLFGENIMQLELPYKIQFVFSWLMFAFIGIGVITLIRRYKEMSFPELNFKKPDFLIDKFEVAYFGIALVCSGLLAGMVALPYLSVGYNLDRLYAVAITILSVFFVIGGGTLSRHSKVRAYFIILLVLIPYFFCCTGVMYNLLSVPRAIILNSEGEQYDLMYVHDQEIYSVRWLRDNGELEDTMTYTDTAGGGILKSQALIWQYDTHSLFDEDRKINGYIHLRYYNVVDGKLLDNHYEEQNITEYQDKFVGKKKIYNNGGSEIWK